MCFAHSLALPEGPRNAFRVRERLIKLAVAMDDSHQVRAFALEAGEIFIRFR